MSEKTEIVEKRVKSTIIRRRRQVVDEPEVPEVEAAPQEAADVPAQTELEPVKAKEGKEAATDKSIEAKKTEVASVKPLEENKPKGLKVIKTISLPGMTSPEKKDELKPKVELEPEDEEAAKKAKL